LLGTTITLARSFNVSPFEIMAQDCDEVIMLINYFIEKADDDGTKPAAVPAANSSKEKYIKVNSKTATGGWW
jgi:hypothetical protein